MDWSLLKIGRGKKFSIAKAGLILYYWLVDNNAYFSEKSFFDYGELPYMHAIIEIAGAKHASWLTSRQVIACLLASPYWDCNVCHGFYAGIGNGKASLCKPSVKGKEYYEKNLKDVKVDPELAENF